MLCEETGFNPHTPHEVKRDEVVATGPVMFYMHGGMVIMMMMMIMMIMMMMVVVSIAIKEGMTQERCTKP